MTNAETKLSSTKQRQHDHLNRAQSTKYRPPIGSPNAAGNTRSDIRSEAKLSINSEI